MNFRLLPVGFAACLASALCLGSFSTPAKGCTIAVVSGKVTEDGRPLLWKNRDTDSRENLVQSFADGKYRVMAVIDAGRHETIWMGMNDAGLCIVNSLSLDLPGGSRVGRGNGRFMKWVLQNCGDAADFERLLVETNASGRRTRGNFGVIDSAGSALLFEVGHRKFTKFDANDAERHSSGFVVRSNFAMTATGAKQQSKGGDLIDVYSGRRYLRAHGLVANYLKQNGRLDYRFFLQNLSRDISNSIDGPIGVRGYSVEGAPQPWMFQLPRIDTARTINRQNTVSAVVFHGVKPGNTPEWTTMWTLLGEPAFSVAVPCWISSTHLPAVLNGPERSPLCATAGQLRELNYVTSHDLSTRSLGRIWSETLSVENQIIAQATSRLTNWRQEQRIPRPEEANSLQDSLAASALESLIAIRARMVNRPALAEKPETLPIASKGEPDSDSTTGQ